MRRLPILTFWLTTAIVSATPANSPGNPSYEHLIQKWQKGYEQVADSLTQTRLKHRWTDEAIFFELQSHSGTSIGRCRFQDGQTLPTDLKTLKGIRANSKKNKKNKNTSKPRAKGQSPDGKWQAWVKDGMVFLKATDSNQSKQIGSPSDKRHYYEGKPVWNQTSSHFYLQYVVPGQRRHLTLVESSPSGQLQPQIHRLRYDKPGDRIDRREPHIFSTRGQVHSPDPTLSPNPYSLNHAAWGPEGKELRYEYVERGFGQHSLLALNAETGQERTIVRESSETFIFVSGVRYRKQLPQRNEIIWGSDRDGWRHLYLLDATQGKVISRITRGEWPVRSIESVDTKNRQLIFTASGRNPGEDPYHIHWYRVNFDGSQLTPLTQGDGTHSLEFSPCGRYYLDTWSRVDQPPVYELRRSRDGSQIAELSRGDASRLAQHGRHLPQRFHCKDRHNRFDIWGVIHTPPHFDPNKKYPVIENIYAGPHGAFAPKPFSPWIQPISELLEEGFIVVNIDALGTNFRHRDFSHFAYKNLIDSGFPDRIKWIKQAAQSRPYMDLTRVGIYGGSAGGQSSTAALLHHGDFYKVAVSDCGCHDNRMDKIWWNEQWMDWPVGPHYKAQANTTHAHKLQGALMLTVGELDRNVDPASTLQLADALLKANKHFDLVVAPGKGHGAGESPALRCRRALFFRQHLTPGR